jgi:hypothetical protein
MTTTTTTTTVWMGLWDVGRDMGNFFGPETGWMDAFYYTLPADAGRGWLDG